MRQFGWALGLLMLLGGCETAQDPKSDAARKACASQEFERYLWQPADILQGLSLPEPARVIEPDMAVTMDYRPERLNIYIGASNRIERVYCG